MESDGGDLYGVVVNHTIVGRFEIEHSSAFRGAGYPSSR